MSKQVDPRYAEEKEMPASGLLLSVEPIHGGGQYSAKPADNVDAGADKRDSSREEADTDGTDTSDVDGTDESDADGTDDSDADGTDDSEADGTDQEDTDTDGTDTK